MSSETSVSSVSSGSNSIVLEIRSETWPPNTPLNTILKYLICLATPVLISVVTPCGLHAAEPAEDEEAELAKKLNNPISDLISVPFQANEDFHMGPTGKGYQFKLNFQPVVPISLGHDWNLIVRTILPVIDQHDVFYQPVPRFPGLPDSTLNKIPPALRIDAENLARKLYDQEVKNNPQNRSQDGLGDTVQSFFLSPKDPGPGGIIWAVGPVFLYPTATQDLLGGEKWGMGPTFVLLEQTGPWTIGVLANQIWSVGGTSTRDNISASFLQPFIVYTTKTHTSFSLNTESTYDWESSQWTVPINVGISQILKIGKQPVSIQIGGRYYADGPSGAPDWGLRVAFTMLFPTGKHEPAPAPSGKYTRPHGRPESRMNPSWLYQQDTIWVIVALFVAMILAGELGARLGRRWYPRADDLRRGHFVAVLGSLLGLLALLISFTFAMSANRYDARRQLVVTEANVLGGLHLQSGLLPAAPHQQFDELLRQYVDLRVPAATLRRDPTTEQIAQLVAESDVIFLRMWKVIQEAALAQPPAHGADAMLKGLLDAASIQRERLLALESRVPDPVIWMLLLGALVAMSAVGLAGGLGNHRGLPARIIVSVLICGTIEVVLDLDKPHQGLIQVSQTPMIGLQQVLHRESQVKP